MKAEVKKIELNGINEGSKILISSFGYEENGLTIVAQDNASGVSFYGIKIEDLEKILVEAKKIASKN